MSVLFTLLCKLNFKILDPWLSHWVSFEVFYEGLHVRLVFPNNLPRLQTGSGDRQWPGNSFMTPSTQSCSDPLTNKNTFKCCFKGPFDVYFPRSSPKILKPLPVKKEKLTGNVSSCAVELLCLSFTFYMLLIHRSSSNRPWKGIPFF